MNYTLCITETLYREIELEADNEIEVMNLAKDMYNNEDIVLDSRDYVDTQIMIKEESE